MTEQICQLLKTTNGPGLLIQAYVLSRLLFAVVESWQQKNDKFSHFVVVVFVDRIDVSDATNKAAYGK